VKNIPKQNAKMPKIEPMNATIINPKKMIGCFETKIILYFIEAIAFKFPKIIRGIDR
jgi:hypothetical protein